MKTETVLTAVCPKCGNAYSGHPALSRPDNETLICPDYGVREALRSIGILPEGQEKIIDIIHRTAVPSD